MVFTEQTTENAHQIALHIDCDLSTADDMSTRQSVYTAPAISNPPLEARTLRIFIGYDPRQSVSYTVLQHSLLQHASMPLQITPLVLEQLPIDRKGLTPFTYSRFLVPWLCNYEGWALFLDADIIALEDIAQLFAYADPQYAIMVSKNPQQFEWASVMLFHCNQCRMLTPEFVQTDPYLFSFHFLESGKLGAFPNQWNHLVGYDTPKNNQSLVHFTQGVPAFPEIAGCEYTNEWANALAGAFHHDSWDSIMGNSVHSTVLEGKRIPKLKAKAWYQSQGIFSRQFPSPRYEALIELYRHMHDKGDPNLNIPAEKMFSGITLPKHAENIKDFLSPFPVQTLLDYGCGKGQQYRMPFQASDGTRYADIPSYWGNPKIFLYDPGYGPFQQLPKNPCDAVICTDVLEHLPEEDLEWILSEILQFSRHAVYMSVATYPARKSLPNGENAHITVREGQWWIDKIGQIRNQYTPHIALQLAVDSISSTGKLERQYAVWKA